MEKIIKIMFLCTGNTCRSQMAEGFAKSIGKDNFQVFSAGVKAEGFINPYAIRVMKEIGVDISNQQSKVIDYELLKTMNYVITLCSNAEETCPVTPPQIKRFHIPIDDPSKVKGNEDEILFAFRKTRDEIELKIRDLLSEILSN